MSGVFGVGETNKQTIELHNEHVRMELNSKEKFGIFMKFFGRFFSVSKVVLGCAKKASNVSTGVPWV